MVQVLLPAGSSFNRKPRRKKNMIVSCFSNNEGAIKFYEKMGGKVVKTKTVKIGDDFYEENVFYFQIK